MSSTTLLLESKMVIDSSSKSSRVTSNELTLSQELFFKRVLHHCALEVHQLCEQLHLPEKFSEHVWTVMKYILSSETSLLIERNLIQIILCSVYGVCKVFHQPLKFQEIITKYTFIFRFNLSSINLRYSELPTFNKNEVQEIIYGVYIKENDRVDLIKFYNTVYISQIKTFLFSLVGDKNSYDPKSNTPMIKRPMIPALVIESPLRESLPYHMQNSALNKKKSPLLKLGMTPFTSALYAESPRPMENLNNNITSRKMLNMDEPDNYQNDLLLKKLKNGGAFMDKIIEQKSEETDMDSSKKSTLLSHIKLNDFFNSQFKTCIIWNRTFTK